MSKAKEHANGAGADQLQRKPASSGRADDLPEDTPTAGERFRPLTRLVLTGCLLALCVWLAFPFLPAITWAVALAIIAWPMHAWLTRHLARPWLAAGLTTAAVVLTILVPLLFVTYQLAIEAREAADYVQQGASEGAVRETLVQAPVLNEVVEWAERFGVDVDREVRKAVAITTRDLAGVTNGSIWAALQTLVALFLLYHLFLSRGELTRGLRNVLPLSNAEADRVFSKAAGSVYANLYANTLTSVIDGVGGGLVFWLLGLPSPVLWGTVLFVLSFLPAVGTGFVWLPVAGYLLLTGRFLAGTVMLGWGILSAGIIGNLLYARLAGGRMRLHEALTLVAYMGGLAVFGISGIILGPAIYAVTIAILEVWRKPATEDEALPVVAAAPAPSEA